MDIKDTIYKFIKNNPDPSDDKFHGLAEKLNIEPDELEAGAYALLSDFINEGRYKEDPPSKMKSSELAKGVKIEMEHTDNPTIAKRIAMDHLAEDAEYYTKLIKMEKEGAKKCSPLARKAKKYRAKMKKTVIK